MTGMRGDIGPRGPTRWAAFGRDLARLGVPVLLLSGCAADGSSFLHPHGLVANAQRYWLFEITLWMMVIILPVFFLVPFVAWRYRRRSTRSAYRPKWEFSWPLEFLVWGLPAIVVAFMAVVIVTRETPLDPYRPIPSDRKPLDVQVVALDWKWLFVYPDQHIATVGMLALPLDRPVDFHLTSDSTMQSFFIPSLGSQIYVMAGMVTQLHLIADRTGTMLGENTQYNGDHFQNDKFDVTVLAPSDFDQWVAAQAAAPRTLDPASYGQLVRHDTTADAKKRFGIAPSAVLSFRLGQPEFFSSVVGKYNPSAMHEMRASAF